MESGPIAAPSDASFEERYALGPQVGSGTSAEVYAATQRALDRPVAIKFLSARHLLDPDWRDRFLREAQISATLTHPNVIKVFDHGVWNERPYLVTELVEGRSLAEIMAEPGRMTAGAVFRIVEQVLDGLEAIHGLDIVHRDLKPDNILVGTADEMPVKITDFGVAKHYGSQMSGPSTAQGVVLGTPAYMAPEQVAGSAPGPASDLYSLCTILFQLVTGALPFQAETNQEMLRHQLLTEPTIPWSLHPHLRALLERGLAKSLKVRFANAAEFRAALRPFEAEILGEAGVVGLRSGPVPMPGVRTSGAHTPPGTGPYVAPGSGVHARPHRLTITVRTVRRLRRAVIALGVAGAALVAMALPRLLWLVP